ncbi:MAG: hypothetical protein NC179_00210, partial [[Eubacterium] siraeum]|nr:hypothetical protein [[Eubacterium] siraeum]
ALAEFVRSREYDGYNVTIPYKRAIMPLIDEVSHSAKEVGAVNTVVTEGGKLVGYNTDVAGMSYALRRGNIRLKGKNVLILGSGGTCQTAKYVCKSQGAARVDVVSRSGEINYGNCYDLKDVQVVINTTPVGMMPNSLNKPIDLNRYSKLEGVFDCIYNPLETMLIRDARALNVNAANGLAMLIEQARVAHNLFQEARNLPTVGEDMTARVISELAKSRLNIVLVGMAGSGKSAIGKLVADRLGRQFVDTDGEIVSVAGKSIPEIFKENGEAYFREIERQVVERICARQGLVISTGGGVILDDKNVFFMKSNGVCYLIERDADKLATNGRPLSPDKESAKRLYEKRKPLYLAAADAAVDNNGDIEKTVEQIVSDFCGKERKV